MKERQGKRAKIKLKVLRLKKETQSFITDDKFLKFDARVSRDQRLQVLEIIPEGAPMYKYSPKFTAVKP